MIVGKRGEVDIVGGHGENFIEKSPWLSWISYRSTVEDRLSFHFACAVDIFRN